MTNPHARVEELEHELAEARNQLQILMNKLAQLRAAAEEARWHTPTRVRELLIAALEETRP